MELDKDDYFVIDEVPQEITNSAGAKIQILSDFDGLVFQAKEVCGDFVAAKLIERDSFESPIADLIISLNRRRYNIFPVTRQYAECIMKSRKNPASSMFQDLQEIFEAATGDEVGPIPPDFLDFNGDENHGDGP